MGEFKDYFRRIEHVGKAFAVAEGIEGCTLLNKMAEPGFVNNLRIKPRYIDACTFFGSPVFGNEYAVVAVGNEHTGYLEVPLIAVGNNGFNVHATARNTNEVLPCDAKAYLRAELKADTKSASEGTIAAIIPSFGPNDREIMLIAGYIPHQKLLYRNKAYLIGQNGAIGEPASWYMNEMKEFHRVGLGRLKEDARIMSDKTGHRVNPSFQFVGGFFQEAYKSVTTPSTENDCMHQELEYACIHETRLELKDGIDKSRITLIDGKKGVLSVHTIANILILPINKHATPDSVRKDLEKLVA